MLHLNLQDERDESVSARIARALSERIINGALAPGTPVRQDRVADEFRASHVPVREAFRILEARGLLVSEPRRGVRVAPLDPDDLVELTEMRAALEALALEQAFENFEPKMIEICGQLIDEAEASADVLFWEENNRRFHAMLMPSSMPRLAAAVATLQQASARYLLATWRELDWQARSNEEHRRIVAELEAGRIASATSVLRSHILDAGYALAATIRRRTG